MALGILDDHNKSLVKAVYKIILKSLIERFYRELVTRYCGAHRRIILIKTSKFLGCPKKYHFIGCADHNTSGQCRTIERVSGRAFYTIGLMFVEGGVDALRDRCEGTEYAQDFIR